MTRKLFSSLLLGAALFLTSCGDSSSGNGAPAPVTEIKITGNDLMQFSVKEFVVKAGTEVTITLENIGVQPIEAMGHNLIVLTAGSNPVSVATAGQGFTKDNYIAPADRDKVIAATKLIGPGESDSITFTAPAEAGDYPYVCTFPAHSLTGMRGVMKVIP